MRKIGVLLGCVLLLSGVLLGVLWHWWHNPQPDQPVVELVVDRGSSLGSVARELEARGALRWPRVWSGLARLQGVDGEIKRGEYHFTGDMSPAALLEALVVGRVVRYSVTLPEGITLGEALVILQQQEALESLLDGAGDPRLLALAHPLASAEGLFFPDTYSFVRGDTDLSILETARQRMRQMLESSWPARDVGLPYRTEYEALVMASIIEKETGLAGERDRIAGVFVRRMQRNMRLQTDPTVIYGLGANFDGNLRRRHLADRDNAYNTYQHKGLPPTPIALPGAAAIRAALHPATGDELYFVARGDGSHVFSETLEQHQEAVRKYQLQRRQDYRSAPPAGESRS